MIRQHVGEFAAPIGQHGTEHRRRMRRADDRWGDLFQAFGEWIADRDLKPTFIVNADLIPLSWNRAAERLVRQNTWIRVLENQPLKIDDQQLDHALRSALGRARGTVTRVRSATRALDVALLRPRAAACNMYVIRHPEPLAPTIDRRMLRRKFKLTKTECEVVIGIHRGGSRKAVAKDCGLTLNTIKTHLQSIFPKFRAHSQRDVRRQVDEWLAEIDAGSESR